MKANPALNTDAAYKTAQRRLSLHAGANRRPRAARKMDHR